MKVRVTLVAGMVASLGAACGLVQVNGKPVSIGSSSSEPKQEQQPASQPEAKPAVAAASSANDSSMPASQPAAASAAPSSSEPGKQLEDIAKPGVRIASWTPVQQFIQLGDRDSYYALITADELGDKLSQAGRIAVVRRCLGDAKPEARSAALWAICSGDVEAFKLDAFGAELAKEGIDAGVRKQLLDSAKQTLDHAKAVGAAVTAAAKEDPGIEAIVAMGPTARNEWREFAAAHADELAALADMQDSVREEKNGLAKDCVAKTYAPFAKVIRSTKISDADQNLVSTLEYYVNSLPKALEAQLAVLSWSACAALVHTSGGALYTHAVSTRISLGGGQFKRHFARRGPRSLTTAKLFDSKFAPKFTDRNLRLDAMTQPHGDYRVQVASYPGTQPVSSLVAKLVKDGDATTVKGKSYLAETCVDWRDTKKVNSVDTQGNVHYEKKCAKYENVRYDASDVETATAFVNGISPGLELTAEDNYPIYAMKGRRKVFVLGVPLK